MGACRLDPSAVTIESLVSTYMQHNPDADRRSVFRAAAALDANCSGLVHQCETRGPSSTDPLVRELGDFMNDRELEAHFGGPPSGFDYRNERRPNQCELLLSHAEQALPSTARALTSPSGHGVQLARSRPT